MQMITDHDQNTIMVKREIILVKREMILVKREIINHGRELLDISTFTFWMVTQGYAILQSRNDTSRILSFIHLEGSNSIIGY